MKNKKGSVLVFALIILSFILVAAFSTSSIALIERRSADASVNSSTAFQNSDKGMEEFLQQLYKELDQSDTLKNLADALGSEYACVEPDVDTPARIGGTDTEFIITAYTERPPAPTDATEWDAVTAIEDCDTPLANVSRFRATGNHNNTARAVFLKLRNSLTRGLVAHWSFEDRAQNASNAVHGEAYNSFMAMDSSKNNYTLTLCDVYDSTSSDDAAKIKFETTDENENDVIKYVVSFDEYCNKPNKTENRAMNPFKQDDDCDDDNVNDKCSKNGAWVDGIVKEGDNSGEGIGEAEVASSEALYFDGDDYLTALIDDDKCYNAGGSSDCDSTMNYVEEDSAKRLNLDDGISISLWFKPEVVDITQTLVSKGDMDGANEGYRLSVVNDSICFALGDGDTSKEICEIPGGVSALEVDEWINIVATWREKGDDMILYIDGTKVDTSKTFEGDIDSGNEPLFIGAAWDSTNDKAINFTNGVIDDVRIWNRALTNREAERICNDADSGDVDCQVVGVGDDGVDTSDAGGGGT